MENVVRQNLSLYFGDIVVPPFCKEKVVLQEEQTSLECDNLLVIIISVHLKSVLISMLAIGGRDLLRGELMHCIYVNM